MTQSTKICRSGNRCQPVSFREALHCQVHHSEMRADEIARHLGISAGTLADGVNPYDEGSILAARHHEKLIELTPDNLTLLTFLARKQGAVVFRIPTNPSVLVQTADTVREFGEFLSTAASAHADGAIDEDEASHIEREGQEAIAAIAALIDESRRRAKRVIPISASATERRG